MGNKQTDLYEHKQPNAGTSPGLFLTAGNPPTPNKKQCPISTNIGKTLNGEKSKSQSQQPPLLFLSMSNKYNGIHSPGRPAGSSYSLQSRDILLQHMLATKKRVHVVLYFMIYTTALLFSKGLFHLSLIWSFGTC